MNLDGETTLKDKYALLKDFEERKLVLINGMVECDLPNDNLEQWDGYFSLNNSQIKHSPANIKNLVLRGSQLRNTEFVIGVVVYTGKDTKIMKNLKQPKHKVSKIMKIMNRMLYSLFVLQLVIILLFSGLNVYWSDNYLAKNFYLEDVNF